MFKKLVLGFCFTLLLAGCATPDGGYPGYYQGNLEGQVIRLWLGADGNVRLTQDPGDGQPPQVDEGTWLGSNDSLDLTFDGRILTFGREDDDSLFLVDDLNHIAPAGLTLQPVNALLENRWVWLQTVANGQTTDPSTAGAFILTFNEDGLALIETDCNAGRGGFVVGAQQRVSLPVIATTRMFCEGSNEGDFYAQLGLVESYTISADGVLELHLGGEGGTMDFSPEA